MLRRLLLGMLWAVPAYVLGAFGGGYLVYLTSVNEHDRSVEAAMTGAFVLGPLAAVIGFVVGALRALRSRTGTVPSNLDVRENSPPRRRVAKADERFL